MCPHFGIKNRLGMLIYLPRTLYISVDSRRLQMADGPS